MLASRLWASVRWSVAASLVVSGCARTQEITTATAVDVSAPTSFGSSSTVGAPTSGPPTTVTLTTNPSTTPSTAAQPATSPAPTSSTTTDPTVAPSTPAGVAAPPLGSGSTPHQLPTDDPDADWGDSHTYPATDLFVHGADGCGGNVVSPVDGTVSQTRPTNRYNPDTDNPAHRGGKTVAVIGDDGVRYYVAHLASIDDDVVPGAAVAAGDRLGVVGTTGRSSACHIHFGISPPCPDLEWSVRRGVIDPAPFLASWRDGGDASPVEAVQEWLNNNPGGCATASAEPNAGDA